jgi:Ca-activated chloride channel family protein
VSLTLQAPVWLLALAPLTVVLWVLRRRGGGASGWRPYVDHELRTKVLLRGAGRASVWPGPWLCYGLGTTSAIVALSGPDLVVGDSMIPLTQVLLGLCVLCAVMGFRPGWLGGPPAGGPP